MKNDEKWAAGFAAAQQELRLINGAVKMTGRAFGMYGRDDLVQKAMVVFAQCYVAEQPVSEAEWEQFRPRVFQKIRWQLGDLRRRENWWQGRQTGEEAAEIVADCTLLTVELRVSLLACCGNARERAIVEQHWFADMPLTQVASDLGVSVRTLRACRQKLRERLLTTAKMSVSLH